MTLRHQTGKVSKHIAIGQCRFLTQEHTLIAMKVTSNGSTERKAWNAVLGIIPRLIRLGIVSESEFTAVRFKRSYKVICLHKINARIILDKVFQSMGVDY